MAEVAAYRWVVGLMCKKDNMNHNIGGLFYLCEHLNFFLVIKTVAF